MIPYQVSLSSSAIPVTVDDVLYAAINNVDAIAGTYTLRILQLGEDGKLIESVQTRVLTALAGTYTIPLRLAKGILAQISLETPTTGVIGGSTYAQLYILRGAVDDAAHRLYLTSGYISYGAPLSYPTAPGAGYGSAWSPNRAYTMAVPGAGAEITDTAASTQATNLAGLVISFTASAAIALRRTELQLGSDTVTYWYSKTRTDMTAGQTWLLIGWLGGPLPADDTVNRRAYFALPNLINVTNLTFVTNTTNLDAGDNYNSGVVLLSSQPQS